MWEGVRKRRVVSGKVMGEGGEEVSRHVCLWGGRKRGKFVNAGGCVDKGQTEPDLEFMSGKRGG